VPQAAAQEALALLTDAEMGPQLPDPGDDRGRATRLALGMLIALAAAAVFIWVMLQLID
jgi:hypothetical protein